MTANRERSLEERGAYNMQSVERDTVAHVLKRALGVLRAEGFSGVIQRLKGRASRHFSQIHTFALAWDSSPIPDVEARGFGEMPEGRHARALQRVLATPLEFKQVQLGEEEEIDELTQLDPWKIPKSFTLEKLREGWLCFVARRGGRILASSWVVVNRDFIDEFSKCRYVLGPEEAYHWRGFCVPSSRGRGIIPRLNIHVRECVRRKYGRTHHLTLVRASNLTIQRTLAKIGWKVVGRAGFVEILGLRFNYLWGRDAFKQTKKRMFLQFNRGPSN